jgi:hypothetical protein
MALLDLQGMSTPSSTKAAKSGASKGCFNGGGGGGGHHISGLSLLLC